ncbi:hypothetical protein BV898_19447 [Hypsibius exemplaris]|uniref:Uncharacterized protein n=1 Tax=Hypsibius exemplaris TaxID=2072580 RepID=A0A9X6NJ36_HYPEX|nr:hypothetical protein BV898_19447 [Hypsibius exemplaris]
MFVASVCSREKIEIRFVKPRTKVNYEYYIQHVMKPPFKNDIPKLYPVELENKVVFTMTGLQRTLPESPKNGFEIPLLVDFGIGTNMLANLPNSKSFMSFKCLDLKALAKLLGEPARLVTLTQNDDWLELLACTRCPVNGPMQATTTGSGGKRSKIIPTSKFNLDCTKENPKLKAKITELSRKAPTERKVSAEMPRFKYSNDPTKPHPIYDLWREAVLKIQIHNAAKGNLPHYDNKLDENFLGSELLEDVTYQQHFEQNYVKYDKKLIPAEPDEYARDDEEETMRKIVCIHDILPQ